MAREVALSVNLNKVATVRNARGGIVPSVIDAMQVCVDAGAPGITVHPRADERHVRRSDVLELSRALEPLRSRIEFNIEGDPRPDLVALVLKIRPHQCTLVPVRPGEVTSEAGWPADTPTDELRGIVARMQSVGTRVSVFVDAEAAPIRWAASVGADRVELYTEPWARAHASTDARVREASLQKYVAASALAGQLGLGVNAGHDLDLENLGTFARTLPVLHEVSIGHALVSRALFVGLGTVVREYLAVLAG